MLNLHIYSWAFTCLANKNIFQILSLKAENEKPAKNVPLSSKQDFNRFSELEDQVERSVSNRFSNQYRNRDIDEEIFSDSTVHNDFTYVDSETNAPISPLFDLPGGLNNKYSSQSYLADDSFGAGSFNSKVYATFSHKPRLNSEEDVEIGAVKHNYYKKPQMFGIPQDQVVIRPNNVGQTIGNEVTHFTLNTYTKGANTMPSYNDQSNGLGSYRHFTPQSQLDSTGSSHSTLGAKQSARPTIEYSDQKNTPASSPQEYELHKAVVRINPKTKELSLLIPQSSSKNSANPNYTVKNTIPYPSYFDNMLKEFDNNIENIQQASSYSAQTEPPYSDANIGNADDLGLVGHTGHTFQTHYQYHSAPTLTRQTDIHTGNLDHTPITEEQHESYAPQYPQNHPQNQLKTIENHFQYHPVPVNQHATHSHHASEAGNPSGLTENYSYASGYPLNQYRTTSTNHQYQPIPVLQSTATADQSGHTQYSSNYAYQPAPAKTYVAADHYQQVKQSPAVSTYTYQVHEPVAAHIPHVPATPAPYATPHDPSNIQHINYNSHIQHPSTGSTKKQIGNVIVRVDPKTKEVFLDLPNWHPIINHFAQDDLKSNKIVINSQLAANGQTQSTQTGGSSVNHNAQLFTPHVEPQTYAGHATHKYRGLNGSLNSNDLKIKQSYILPPHQSEAYLSPSASFEKYKTTTTNATNDNSKKYAFHSFYEILQNAAKKLKTGLFGGNKR